ncbi:MAG: hypothetical protein ACLGHT_12880, partial [Acidimicrobiia bacterium]
DDAPGLDIATSLRAALEAARSNFGEPEAIALVHRDGAEQAELGEISRQARSASVGPVRLVPESVARRYDADLATGAALWLLGERAVAAPVVSLAPTLAGPPPDDSSLRSMDDFGAGRSMSDFGDGTSMDDHDNGRRMSDFGAGVSMADHAAGGEPRRHRRVQLVAAAVAVVVVVGLMAAVALASRSGDAASIAATGVTTTTEEEGHDGTGITPGERSIVESPTTTAAVAPGGATTTVGGGAPATAGPSSTSPTAPTTTAPAQSGTFAAGTTRSYDVIATLEQMEQGLGGHPLYSVPPGTREPGTVTVECSETSCVVHLDVPAWRDPAFPDDPADYNGHFITSGPIVDGHLETTQTQTMPDCPDTSTDTFVGDFAETTASGTYSREGAQCPNGRIVAYVVSFATP